MSSDDNTAEDGLSEMDSDYDPDDELDDEDASSENDNDDDDESLVGYDKDTGYFSPAKFLARVKENRDSEMILDMEPSEMDDTVRAMREEGLTTRVRFLDFVYDLTRSLKANTSITSTEIGNCFLEELSPNSRTMLFRRLADLRNLTDFVVNCDFTSTGEQVEVCSIEYVPLLLKAPGLKVFDVAHVDFHAGRVAITEFARGLRKQGKTLETIDLGVIHCHLLQETTSITPILNALLTMPNITTFRGQVCGGSGLTISNHKKLRELVRHPTLKYLSLNGILEPEHILLIAKELETDTILKTLDLSYNNYGPRCGAALVKMMESNLSLERVVVDQDEMSDDAYHQIQLMAQLNTAGRCHLLNQDAERGTCINVLGELTNNLDALYTALRLRPDLCHLSHDERLQERLRVLEERATKLEQKSKEIESEQQAIAQEKDQLQQERQLYSQKQVSSNVVSTTPTNK